jgi:hypothetical protein
VAHMTVLCSQRPHWRNRGSSRFVHIPLPRRDIAGWSLRKLGVALTQSISDPAEDDCHCSGQGLWQGLLGRLAFCTSASWKLFLSLCASRRSLDTGQKPSMYASRPLLQESLVQSLTIMAPIVNLGELIGVQASLDASWSSLAARLLIQAKTSEVFRTGQHDIARLHQ